MTLKDVPSLAEIITAEERINAYIHRTPVFKSDKLNQIVGGQLYFKCENLQKGGSFKIRGAMNAALALDKKALEKGIATHSSGNHAQAISIVASKLGIKSYIVMPSDSPEVKVDAVRGYGGQVIYCEPGLKAREERLNDVITKTGATFIPPYNSYDIICGQASMMKEFIEDTDHVENFFIPIGGGGLISGAILSATYLNKSIHIYGAEPKGADDAYRSLLSGKIEPMVNPNTIADGLKTSLGKLTFPIIKSGVEEIITVSEEEIISSMKLIFQYLKLVVEPSAAVPLAALIKTKDRFQNMKIGLILCGGNIDLRKLPF